MSAASTGSSLSLLPHMSTAPEGQGFEQLHPQTSRLSNSTCSGSSEVSVAASATPAPVAIDLNTMPIGGGSSSTGARKLSRELPTNVLGNARNPFDIMPTPEDEANCMFMKNLINEGGDDGIPFDPNETQS
ncbi:putative serine/threonine-protein kinase [Hordeum vulgare]|nr:putative serine/threonine-protein kinase [Hordeum vulgare]